MDFEGGIDIERIADTKANHKAISRVTCPICTSVLWKPISCSLCKKDFCKGCMDHYISTQKPRNGKIKCPNRCAFVQSRSHPIIYDLLSDFHVSCKHAKKGCKEILNYDALEKHESVCRYNTESCPGCRKQLFVKDLTEHKLMCPHVKIECHGCSNVFKRGEMNSHIVGCLIKLKTENKRLRELHHTQQSELTQSSMDKEKIKIHMRNVLSLHQLDLKQAQEETKCLRENYQVLLRSKLELEKQVTELQTPKLPDLRIMMKSSILTITTNVIASYLKNAVVTLRS
jgi:hypothetical protein